jgi:N-acylneuraminate cytidylyltransferase
VIGTKRVLAIIPARGGSKGVPRKNIREVAGKPLIAWSIDEAKKSRYLDRLVVSTDDPEIAEVAARWGGEVPFLRPAELAKDDTPGIAPVLHAVETVTPSYDIIVLLQPTSPLRSTADIDNAILTMVEGGAKACVSVVEPDKSPFWMYSLDATGRMKPLLEGEYACRQEIPAVYALNGALYVAERGWLLERGGFMGDETVAYVMPKERSVDIDTEMDLFIASQLLSR